MIEVSIRGIGFIAPGIADWPDAERVLAGTQAYLGGALDPPVPDVLPSTERRRASASTRLAIAAAQQAVAMAGVEPAALASVFASADNDGETLHQICSSLASEHLEISPTRFHNSVHNAASGYWTIAVHSRAPTSMITGADDVFASGLLEAAVQATTELRDVLLVAYDVPMPPPLDALHPVAVSGSLALALAPERSTRDVAGLGIELVPARTASVSRMRDPELEALRIAYPVGRALPMLARVAQRESGNVVLGLNADNSLRVRIDSPR